MYLEHFRLKEAPFMLTPNTQYFCKLPAHHAAFNVLMLHLRGGEGFIKITGNIGSGKTLLCRMLLENLDEKFFTAYIPNPDLEALTLRKSLAKELGIAEEHFDDPHKLLSAINQRLIELHESGKQVILIIDEAQALPTESLETLRLLTNLETQTAKLLQIVLFGQPELDMRLSQGSLRQLRQRIGFSSKLPVLKYAELVHYVNFRLSVAGYHGETLFTLPARLLLYWKSKGVPRITNILSHKALMSAYGRGKFKVGLKDMNSAVQDTEYVMPQHSWFATWLGLTLAAACAAVLCYWRFHL